VQFEADASEGVPDVETSGADADSGVGVQEPGSARALCQHWPQALIAFCGTAGIATMWYVPPFWTLSAILDGYLSASSALWVSNTCQLVGLAVTPLAGWLTDRYGVGLVTFVGAALFAAAGLPVYVWLVSDPEVTTALVGVGLVYGLAQGFSGATIYLFVGELFPARIRAQGIAISYNLAISFIGGFGGEICTAIVKAAPQYGPGLYFSATGLFSAMTVLVAVFLQRRGLVTLTHRRLTPYFGSAGVKGF